MVSIIIPCRNEERFIGRCLDSILTNSYPLDRMEVLVVDGMSEDRTRTIVEDYVKQHSFIKFLENPNRITPTALNLGVSNAKGDVIFWMSAHNRYKKDYISRSIQYLNAYGADNVGGVIVTLPRENTFTGRAIVACLSHPFGVGNSHFRILSKEPKWVDTVFGGCYRREVFERVGLFNERLRRGQDMEFNLRLKKAGGRTLLVPEIVSYYYARSDLRSFWKHNWGNGLWAILPFLYSEVVPVSWRHLVPLAFVLGLIGSAVLGLFRPEGVWLLAAVVGSYGAANLLVSAHIAWRERDIRYLFVMPFVFASLHVAYGTGSLWGLAKAAGHLLSSLRVRSRQASGTC